MKTREIAVEYRLAHWAQIMRERSESGLTIKAFCGEAGIHLSAYYYWLHKLREAACTQLAERETESVPCTTSLTVQSFAEVTVAREPASQDENVAGQLCIEVGGCKITADSGYPVGSLAALLRELEQPC